MSNWRRFKNAAQTTAIAATILSSALAGAAEARGHTRSKTPSRKPASADDFKFPIVLCRFKQAVLKDSGGILKVAVDRDWGPEYAFPVGNVRATDSRADNGQTIHVVNGDFSGTYEIQGSPYRLRLEGAIEQGLDLAGNHQLRLRTVLEKKLDKADASGKLWQEVGNSSNAVIAKTQTDGTVWENVYPYTFNSSEMQRYMSGGKLKQDLVIAGIRDGLLEKGSVFKVGPACGFLDGRTAKSVASAEDKQKFRAIFDKIPDAASSETALAASASAEPKKVLSLKLPEAAPQTLVQAPVQASEQVQVQASNDSSNVSGAVRDQQEEQDRMAREAHAEAHQEAAGGQDLAQGQPAQPGQAGQAGQAGMTPELQAQLAQQSQLADQAAAAYNMQSQQAQNGQLPVDGRDPASSGMPQANNVGQIAQNIQNLQSPEQVQQNLNMLEQQKAALAQQQAMIDQQQQFLAQRQQELAASGAAQGGVDPANNASQPEQIQSSQAAPQAAPVGQSF